MDTQRKAAIVEAIHIATVGAGPMEEFSHVNAVAGVGLECDRYAANAGTFSKGTGDQALTFVEAESIDYLRETYGVSLAPGESRRNVTTRGIRLNKLVGKRFTVGSALCEGVELAHPCAHLERVTQRPGLVKQMMGRGGLRARILEGGIIRAGDAVVPEPDGQMDLFEE